MSASVKVEATEKGARLTRSLKVATVFKDARHQLLVFEKR